MESYTDMKYSDCGCSGRCRKVSGNRNQSVRSCLDPAMQAGSGVRYPQMGNQMNDGIILWQWPMYHGSSGRRLMDQSVA